MMPPLTRVDVITGFLRVMMWTIIFNPLLSFISSLYVPAAAFGRPAGFSVPNDLSIFVTPLLPVFILSLFPGVLASSVLGETARFPVESLAEVRPLVWRCVGLYFFIGSLTGVLWSTFVLGHNLITLGTLFGSGGISMGASIAANLAFTNLVRSSVELFFGFALAFGPLLRARFTDASSIR